MGNSNLGKQEVEDDINQLKKSDKDNLNIVIDKILANPVYRDRLKGEEVTMRKFAKVLSTSSELKRTYLNTDWIETVNFVIIIIKIKFFNTLYFFVNSIIQ